MMHPTHASDSKKAQFAVTDRKFGRHPQHRRKVAARQPVRFHHRFFLPVGATQLNGTTGFASLSG
jgi:hypothetical protein